jgi:hypothetical protein
MTSDGVFPVLQWSLGRVVRRGFLQIHARANEIRGGGSVRCSMLHAQHPLPVASKQASEVVATHWPATVSIVYRCTLFRRHAANGRPDRQGSAL